MASQKKIGVLLSGCGHRDGSEIHEATCTLLSIAMHGAVSVCMAPDQNQYSVKNHLNGDTMDDHRNCKQESARIARGDIVSISDISAGQLDGLVIPGGLGMAANLSSYLDNPKEFSLNDNVLTLIQSLITAHKPIAAICIAPVLLAKALQVCGISAKLTIGNAQDVAGHIESMGHTHECCHADQCIVDQKNRVITTPAYMTAQLIDEVYHGIHKSVAAMMKMISA